VPSWKQQTGKQQLNLAKRTLQPGRPKCVYLVPIEIGKKNISSQYVQEGAHQNSGMIL
jgi:hypothetical protein